MDPLVSVIIPCYDQVPTIGLCLRSVAAQTYPAAVAAATGVTVRRLPDNLGPSAARDLGAEHAHGEILFLLDADVAVEPDGVPAAVAQLRGGWAGGGEGPVDLIVVRSVRGRNRMVKLGVRGQVGRRRGCSGGGHPPDGTDRGVSRNAGAWVVAAGDENVDACGAAPAGLLVRGSVRIGRSVSSTFRDSNTDTDTRTATSQAAPHVAGAAQPADSRPRPGFRVSYLSAAVKGDR